VYADAMSVLKRMSTLIKSNLNDLIDGMQDPGKELDQMVLDMEDSGRKARGEVASALADEKRFAKHIESLKGEAASWENKAEQAVKAGDDVLARAALVRVGEKNTECAELEKNFQEQQVHVDNLTTGLKALDARIRDVKLRQGTLREKARAAKGASPLSNKSGAFADFDRMAGKIDAIEAEAGLDAELGGHTPEQLAAESKLNAMSEDGKVDDALAALKKKLGG